MAKPRVFFDMSAGGQSVGRIVMEVNRFFSVKKLDKLSRSFDHMLATPLRNPKIFLFFKEFCVQSSLIFVLNWFVLALF